MEIYAATPELVGWEWSGKQNHGQKAITMPPGLLDQKDAFFIDVFDTFLLPGQILVECDSFITLKEEDIRTGFLDFLRHYCGKNISVHTDSYSSEHLKQAIVAWGIKEYVDNVFGQGFFKSSAPDGTGYWIKDFAKMTARAGVDIKSSLVIGDGKSCTRGAIHDGIDILLVPTYRHESSRVEASIGGENLSDGKSVYAILNPTIKEHRHISPDTEPFDFRSLINQHNKVYK